MPTAYEICQGIGQVIGLYGHHGALDDKGEPVKIGLKREEEYKITDKQVMDGFGVTLSDGKLKISYQSDVKAEESHEKGFESEIEGYIQSVANFLQKEFKKLTGKTLSLSKDGEVSMTLQSTSRVRFWVEAYAWYNISNLDNKTGELDEDVDKLGKAVKDWLTFAKAKRPDNESISAEDNSKSKTKTPWSK